MRPKAFLLDTQVLIWLASQRRKIKRRTLQLLENPNHTLWISAISIWEIGVKKELGKLKIPENWRDQISDWQARELTINWEHASRASGLPRHHEDPFDRMLIAQAHCEEMTIVTSDSQIHQYQVSYLEP